VVLENKRQNSRPQPDDAFGGAVTSGFRVRRRFHKDANVLDLTSKGRRNFCQAKSAGLTTFLLNEHHISDCAPPALAIGGIEVPIGGAKIVARGVPESSRSSFDRLGRALKFEKAADRCFIEVHMEPAEAQAGAIFFVTKGGAEAQGPQDMRPAFRMGDCQFPFEALLVPSLRCPPPSLRRGWRFGGEYCARRARGNERRSSGRLDPQPKKAACAPQISPGSVIKGVLLEYPAQIHSSQALQTPEERRQVCEGQFNFNFAAGSSRDHGEV